MNRIRERRKEMGLTMKQVGDLIGVTESAVHGYEVGIREPSFDTLIALSKVLDASVDYLICASSLCDGIGARIKERRAALGMTQDQLASAVNTTKQTIYKYETGIIINIPMDRIVKLSSALMTTPAQLTGWVYPAPPLVDSEFAKLLAYWNGAEDYAKQIAVEVLSQHQRKP